MGIFDSFKPKQTDIPPREVTPAPGLNLKNDRALIIRPIADPAPSFEGIPLHRQKLLYFSDGDVGAHGFGMQLSISISLDGKVAAKSGEADDPSTIYTKLPVRIPKLGVDVPKLGYFPSYSGMTPEQRALYGQWLCDTAKPIDTGYVFVYFYGLERQLVTGDFSGAVDEILFLRKYHKNSSFLSYSALSLVHACLLRKRLDTLQHLYTLDDFDYFGNSNLLALHHGGLDMPPDILIRLAGSMPGVNRRYVKDRPEVYREALLELLQQQFCQDSYPFASRFLLENIAPVNFVLFANISFPPNIRTPSLPNFFRHEPFAKELGSFFKEVHKAVTVKLREQKAT